MVRDIGRAIKGYTADDIQRLKEGGIQQVEGKGLTAVAEAEAKVAEAAERHAKAEHECAEAIKARAEAYAIRKKADGESAKDFAIAFANLVEAVSRIKQEGGSASFDSEQIRRLLIQGQAEFPNDKQIQGIEISDENLADGAEEGPSSNGT